MSTFCIRSLFGRYSILLIFFSIYSCSPVQEITIEVLAPAEFTIPSYVEQIAYMNRSYSPHHAISSDDTIRRTAKELYVIDTIIINKFFLGLNDVLNNSPLFNLGEPVIDRKPRLDGIRLSEPLSESEIRQIGATGDADLLISVDGYDLADTLPYFYSEDTYRYIVPLHIRGRIQWRIYDLVQGTLLNEFIQTDTMEWVAYGNTIQAGARKLPEMVDAYREFAYQNGYEYGLKISPSWSDAKRFYYTRGNKSMKAAGKLASEDHWEQAQNYWKIMSEWGNKTVASRASFNQAIYYELNDSIELALAWAKRSLEQYQDINTEAYIEILEKRIEEKTRVQQQMERGFEEMP